MGVWGWVRGGRGGGCVPGVGGRHLGKIPFRDEVIGGVVCGELVAPPNIIPIRRVQVIRYRPLAKEFATRCLVLRARHRRVIAA